MPIRVSLITDWQESANAFRKYLNSVLEAGRRRDGVVIQVAHARDTDGGSARTQQAVHFQQNVPSIAAQERGAQNRQPYARRVGDGVIREVGRRRRRDVLRENQRHFRSL